MHSLPPWLTYALLAAVASAFVGIFMKFGTAQVDSTLATALRAVIMAGLLVLTWLIIGPAGKLATLTPKAFTMIALSGVAGAAAWFCYFRAISLGNVSQVGPVDKLSVVIAVILAFFLLGERPSAINWLGVALITLGVYLVALPKAGS
jgi:transporter family protein